MSDRRTRTRSVALAAAAAVVALSAGGYIAMRYGTSRAVTAVVAVVLVAALVSLVLAVLSVLATANVRRTRDAADEQPLRNEQRPVTKRVILPEAPDRPVGRRRKNPES